MTIPYCGDCKHFRFGDDLGMCSKHSRPADPFMWAWGIESSKLTIHEARAGPCGREGKSFERKPSLLERLRSVLR
jgi:hypothetical protein